MNRVSSLLAFALLVTNPLGCKQRGAVTSSAEAYPSVLVTTNASASTPVRSAQPPEEHPPQYSELEFFNSLSGRLEIELTESAKPISDKQLNLAAPPTARIKALRLSVLVVEGNNERKLSDAELDSVALRAPHVVFHGESGKQVDHDAPNGEYFTVRDLIDAIEKTERAQRSEGHWMGGIDVHHIYFEGLELVAPGSFQILWGS